MNYALWLFGVVFSGLMLVCFSGMALFSGIIPMPKFKGRPLVPLPAWLLAHMLFLTAFVYGSLRKGIDGCFDTFGSSFWMWPIIFGTSYGLQYFGRLPQAASKAPRLFGKEPNQGPK